MSATNLNSAETDLLFEALSQKFPVSGATRANNLYKARQAMIAGESFSDDQLDAAKYAVERLGQNTKSLKKAIACRALAAKLTA